MTRRGRPPHPDILTPRQRQVLDLIRAGRTDQQIADQLGVSLDGAKYHVSEILSKLGVSSREEAAAWREAERQRVPLVAFALTRLGAALVIAAAVGVIGLLSWGIPSGRGSEETQAVQEEATPTPYVCPPDAECPGTTVWERTGDYQAGELMVMWFEISPDDAHVVVAHIPSPGSQMLSAVWTVTDGEGTQYDVLGVERAAGEVCETGVSAYNIRFERPPDVGQTLIVSASETSGVDAYCQGNGEPIRGTGDEIVAFARNLDTTHGPGYSEGMRIAPENAAAGGAKLEYYPGGSLLVVRGPVEEVLKLFFVHPTPAATPRGSPTPTLDPAKWLPGLPIDTPPAEVGYLYDSPPTGEEARWAAVEEIVRRRCSAILLNPAKSLGEPAAMYQTTAGEVRRRVYEATGENRLGSNLRNGDEVFVVFFRGVFYQDDHKAPAGVLEPGDTPRPAPWPISPSDTCTYFGNGNPDDSFAQVIAVSMGEYPMTVEGLFGAAPTP